MLYASDDNGHTVNVQDEDVRGFYVRVDEGLGVHVSGPGEAYANGDEVSAAKYRCRHCHLVLRDPADYDGKWVAIEDDEVCQFGQCEECQGSGYESQEADEDGKLCETCEGTGSTAHDGEIIPLSWANSAGVILDEDEDAIHLRVSVGDPRGAFVMTLRRVHYADESGERVDELRLSVPDPSDGGWLHMPLTPLNGRGYFRVGK